jgi:hypothetical protein
VSALGAGLQIGISAVSPGFSIVPRERRRKTSGLGLGVAEVEASLGERTVIGNCERIHDDGEISNNTRAGGDRGRQRWKWLKDLLL